MSRTTTRQFLGGILGGSQFRTRELENIRHLTTTLISKRELALNKSRQVEGTAQGKLNVVHHGGRHP